MAVKFGWDKLRRFLAQANTWTGVQTFANAVIQAGSIAASVVVDLVSELASPPVIGKTTPAELWGSPNVSKGPAIIETFAGTVSTSGSSTTITWSSAADAILAGYDATTPVLGTTIITGPIKQASVTRYVISWTNSTTCVVDTACTLAAATELTSVQLPISSEVTSAGVLKQATFAAGTKYSVDFIPQSWTPVITFGGASEGVTYHANNGGRYIKIGNLIILHGRLMLTSKGTSNGSAAITGLPFPAENLGSSYVPLAIMPGGIAYVSQISADIIRNTATISLHETTEAGVATDITAADFSATSEITIMGMYFTP